MLEKGGRLSKLPEVDLCFTELYELLVAPLKENLMLAGIEIGVFDQLVEPKMAEDIADAIRIPAAISRFFLDGLVACDLLSKKKGRYRNTRISQAFLVKDSPTYLGQFLYSYSRYLHSADKHLSDMVAQAMKERTESPGTATWRSEQEQDLVLDMANYQLAGIAQLLAGIVSGLPEFRTMQKMLDLGGGPGLIGIAIVDSHPDIKGVIFDLPGVIKIADDAIRKHGLDARMTVMSGDFDRDTFGSGYDLVLASAVLHISRDMDSLIDKIHNALNPGGIFMSFHEGLTDERTKPAIHVLGYLPMVMTGRDVGMDKGLVSGSMRRAGFEIIESQTLDTPVGPMDLDIARKERIVLGDPMP
jgi:2-polyprenyl-3-methyl-5-hydroxy-6-metoxy-1,4-benzoquinol methylase